MAAKTNAESALLAIAAPWSVHHEHRPPVHGGCSWPTWPQRNCRQRSGDNERTEQEGAPTITDEPTVPLPPVRQRRRPDRHRRHSPSTASNATRPLFVVVAVWPVM